MLWRIAHALLAAWLIFLACACFIDTIRFAVVIGPLLGGAAVTALLLAFRPGIRSLQLLLVILADSAIGGMWLDMSTQSIVDSTGPMLAFTLPVLALLYVAADPHALCLRDLLPTLGPILALAVVWLIVHATVEPRSGTNLYRTFGLNQEYRYPADSWHYQLRLLASVLLVIAFAWGSVRRMQSTT